jgi:hypothetical protein
MRLESFINIIKLVSAESTERLSIRPKIRDASSYVTILSLRRVRDSIYYYSLHEVDRLLRQPIFFSTWSRVFNMSAHLTTNLLLSPLLVLLFPKSWFDCRRLLPYALAVKHPELQFLCNWEQSERKLLSKRRERSSEQKHPLLSTSNAKHVQHVRHASPPSRVWDCGLDSCAR